MEVHFHVNLAPDPEDNQGVADLPRGYLKASLRVIFPQCGKPCLTPSYKGEMQIGAAEAEAGAEAEAETEAEEFARILRLFVQQQQQQQCCWWWCLPFLLIR